MRQFPKVVGEGPTSRALVTSEWLMETDPLAGGTAREVGRCPTTLGSPLIAPLSREIVARSPRAPTYHVCSPVCRGAMRCPDKGQCRSASALSCSQRLFNQRGKVDIQGHTHPKNGIESWPAHPALDVAHHLLGKCCAFRDSVHRKFLSQSFFFQSRDDAGAKRIDSGIFKHADELGDNALDKTYNHSENTP